MNYSIALKAVLVGGLSLLVSMVVAEVTIIYGNSYQTNRQLYAHRVSWRGVENVPYHPDSARVEEIRKICEILRTLEDAKSGGSGATLYSLEELRRLLRGQWVGSDGANYEVQGNAFRAPSGEWQQFSRNCVSDQKESWCFEATSDNKLALVISQHGALTKTVTLERP